MLRYPVEKVSCVGCGYCCIRNTCAFGAALHPHDEDKICPELAWIGIRYVCNLMGTHPLAAFYRQELQSGGGCRSFNNPWRHDVRLRTDAEARTIVSGTPWPTPDADYRRCL